MAALTNSTVLSNFAQVGRIDLLRSVFGKIYVPHEVQEEVLQGIEEGYLFLEPIADEVGVGSDCWLELVGFERPDEEQSFREYARSLGYGEASCLALARSRHWSVLTDDGAARRALRRERRQLTGTLGILKTAVDRALITLEQGNALLERMIDAGYYSPYDDLDGVE